MLFFVFSFSNETKKNLSYINKEILNKNLKTVLCFVYPSMVMDLTIYICVDYVSFVAVEKLRRQPYVSKKKKKKSNACGEHTPPIMFSCFYFLFFLWFTWEGGPLIHYLCYNHEWALR